MTLMVSSGPVLLRLRLTHSLLDSYHLKPICVEFYVILDLYFNVNAPVLIRKNRQS